jgi:[ribosomal protein S5]-alanine N-acetyltransferase
MVNPVLVGKNLYLRPLDREDVAQFLAWLNDRDVTRTTQFFRPITRQLEEEFVSQSGRSEHEIVLGICTKDDRLIGSTGLHSIDFKNRHAAFGVLIGDKREWGKGFGTEVTALVTGFGFETLGLNKVWLHVHADNTWGIRAYRKAGYRKDGLLRQDEFREGRFIDTLVMSVLREEWEKRPRAKPTKAGAK